MNLHDILSTIEHLSDGLIDAASDIEYSTKRWKQAAEKRMTIEMLHEAVATISIAASMVASEAGAFMIADDELEQARQDMAEGSHA